ncbi:hypothetical protein, partial [Streptococcus pneumoniae]|uniref:hypothetical protein n=1 Tax=Streptococcus pneumoniae TaxID=1313 RepID=UPI0018B0A30F
DKNVAEARTTAEARSAVLEAALKEFADPSNWVVNGRFDPHSGNFDATTFARAALAGGKQATGDQFVHSYDMVSRAALT